MYWFMHYYCYCYCLMHQVCWNMYIYVYLYMVVCTYGSRSSCLTIHLRALFYSSHCFVVVISIGTATSFMWLGWRNIQHWSLIHLHILIYMCQPINYNCFCTDIDLSSSYSLSFYFFFCHFVFVVLDDDAKWIVDGDACVFCWLVCLLLLMGLRLVIHTHTQAWCKRLIMLSNDSRMIPLFS